MRIYGFHQVKIKVGAEGQDDSRRLGRMRRILGRGMDIRLDANEAWPASELIDRVSPLLPFRPSALEQPVPHAQVGSCRASSAPGCTRHARRVPVWIPGCTVAAVDHRTADILNVRLSKCGGIFPSFRIIGLAQRSGLGIQLGCHPGETSLAVGRGPPSGRSSRGAPLRRRFLRPSHSRRQLDPADVTFGYGGRARPLLGPGLGVEVDPALLEAMTVLTREVNYE